MVCAVIVAAGRSTRMGGGNKCLIDIAGKPALRRCLEAFQSCPGVDSICLVVAPEKVGSTTQAVAPWAIGKLAVIVAGGDSRGQSVYNGLLALPPECDIVTIQDGARPFVTSELILRSVESARDRGSGVVALRCRDTVKVAGADGHVVTTPDRNGLWLMQTPQTFRYSIILNAYRKAIEAGVEATDDAAIAELAGRDVWLVEGSADNIKLTTQEDLLHGEAIARAREGLEPMTRIGEGYDVHQLVKGRALILGGVEIPHETGLLGHSDADVLTHAIMDALLGAAGLGDIGTHFPDKDAQYKGISSLLLLERVSAKLSERQVAIGNIDATIVAQRPKLAPFIPQMRQNIAQRLSISEDAVNIKATTTEHLGFEGREEGISARAVALLQR